MKGRHEERENHGSSPLVLPGPLPVYFYMLYMWCIFLGIGGQCYTSTAHSICNKCGVSIKISGWGSCPIKATSIYCWASCARLVPR